MEFNASSPEVLNAHLDEHPYLGGDLPNNVDA
jgi:elongation factor 1-beta